MKRILPLMLVAACDHPEAFTDAGDDGAVHVQVLQRLGDHAPVEGVTVLFHDGDGGLLARALTDAEGRASAEVPAGGSVTIHDADGTAPRLATVFDVEPGDELAFATGPWSRSQAIVHYDVPSYPGGTGYLVRGVCVQGGGGASTGNAYVWAGCTAPSPVLAAVSTTAGLQGYLYDPAIAAAPDETFTMTGAWQPPGSFTFDVTGAAGLIIMTPVANVLVGGAPLYAAAGGLSTITPDADGHAQSTFPFPNGVGDATVTQLAIRDASGFRTSSLVESDGTPRTAYTGDAGELLAFGPDATVTETGASWGAVDPSADGLQLWLTTGAALWMATVSPTATSLTLPSLPDDLAPLGAGPIAWTATLAIDDGDLDGYADLRAVADLDASTTSVPPAATGAIWRRVAVTNAPPP